MRKVALDEEINICWMRKKALDEERGAGCEKRRWMRKEAMVDRLFPHPAPRIYCRWMRGEGCTMRPTVHASVHASVHVSVHASVHASSVRPCVRPSVHASVRPSMRPSRPCVRPYVCPTNEPFVMPSTDVRLFEINDDEINRFYKLHSSVMQSRSFSLAYPISHAHPCRL